MEEKIDKIKEGCFYSLLSTCTNQELEPLVKIIIETSTNSLDENERYKKYKPNHKKYHKEIGDEIRLFGSDSFASFLRRGDGIEYEEILRDVCNRLKIPCKEKNIITQEKDLIALYELEKEKYASSTKKDIAKTLSFVTTTLLTKIHPAVAVFSIVQLSSPAFRVTVPCILHIAMLRNKQIEEYTRQLEKNKGSYTENKHELLIVTNKKNETMLSFSNLSELSLSAQENWKSIKVDQVEISRFNSLLQTVPNLTTAHNVNKTKYMEVVINGPLTKAKNGVGYRLQTRGVDGKITENGKLFSPDKLSKLVKFSAIYNIASVAVAQKHLADINVKLNEIKGIVESINSFQVDERESKIKGTILYFEQISNSVMNGKPLDSILHQIEAKECELLGIQTHILKDIDTQNKKENLEDSDTFGTEGLATSIENYQDNIYKLYSLLLMCIRARACGWQLLSCYPVSDDLINSRKDNIRNSLNNNTLLNDTEKSIKNHIRSLSSVFNTEHTLNERKLSLVNKNEFDLQEIKTNIFITKRELITAERQYQNKKNDNAKVFLKIEDGKVVGVSPSFV